jgi:hypothetical protein
LKWFIQHFHFGTPMPSQRGSFSPITPPIGLRGGIHTICKTQRFLRHKDVPPRAKIHDAHGHPSADAVLTATAALPNRAIRKRNVAAHWGGGEFIVLLPETGLPDAPPRWKDCEARSLR